MKKTLTWRETTTAGSLLGEFGKDYKQAHATWLEFDVETQRELINSYKYQSKDEFLKLWESKIQETPNHTDIEDNINSNNSMKVLNKYGINQPSQITVNSFQSSGVTPRLSALTNVLGMFSKMDMQTQIAHDYYINSVGLDFVKIAQNDEVIKQNDKLIEQNNRIIQLLEQSINK